MFSPRYTLIILLELFIQRYLKWLFSSISFPIIQFLWCSNRQCDVFGHTKGLIQRYKGNFLFYLFLLCNNNAVFSFPFEVVGSHINSLWLDSSETQLIPLDLYIFITFCKQKRFKSIMNRNVARLPFPWVKPMSSGESDWLEDSFMFYVGHFSVADWRLLPASLVRF